MKTILLVCGLVFATTMTAQADWIYEDNGGGLTCSLRSRHCFIDRTPAESDWPCYIHPATGECERAAFLPKQFRSFKEPTTTIKSTTTIK
jgi:hypothetical protein